MLVDILDNTKSIDHDAVKEKIGERSRAIIPVHLFGNPVEFDSIRDVAGDLPIIEDACQAHGAKYREKTVGSLGKIAAFSFYPGKNLGAFGDGGAIVTSDKDLFEKTKILRDHGSPSKYQHATIATLLGLKNRSILPFSSMMKSDLVDDANIVTHSKTIFKDSTAGGCFGS